MTAEIINLRQARKRRARAARATEAAARRAQFGRTRAERACAALDEARARQHLNGHDLEPASDTSAAGQQSTAAFSETSAPKSP
ncbi:MAG: DUF4169 family protein [Hyphomicrobiaceae bacterium]